MSVVLDPGHGGAEPAGKSTPRGHAPAGGPPEKAVTLAFAREVAARLGGGATLTRAADHNLSLADRRAVAGRTGARAFVSLHTSPDLGRDAEVWHHPRANAESRSLAASIAQALGGRVRSDAEMAVLAPLAPEERLAAVLVEVDHALAADGRGRAEVGRRLGSALETWLQQRGAPRNAVALEAADDFGIDAPIDDAATMADVQAWSRPLTVTPEYARATRFEPARAGHFTTPASPRTISRVVIHITDGRTTAGAISWFQSAANTGRTSAHYVVGQDGEIVQMVRHADIAHHARGANSDTIGIEHVAVSPATARRYGWANLPPSDIQYAESAALVSWLCDTYGIPRDRQHIVGHSEVGTTSHADCPNSVWDWTYFMSMVQNDQTRMHGRPAPRPAPAAVRPPPPAPGFRQPHGAGESYGRRAAAPARAQEFLELDLAGATSFRDIVGRIATFARRRAQWTAGVPDTTLFPFSAVCQLQLWDGTPGGNPGFGTGFYIGRETILSCGHNFYDTDWRVRRVLVQPGWSPIQSTFATREFAVDGRDLVHDDWRAAIDGGTDALGFDLSVLRVPGLPAPNGQWFELPNLCPVPQDHFVCGFGKVGRTTAEILAEPMRCEGGPVTSADTDLLEYAVNTQEGNSGSPVFVNDGSGMVIAVHTGPSVHNRRRANRGVYLGPEKVDWIRGRA